MPSIREFKILSLKTRKLKIVSFKKVRRKEKGGGTSSQAIRMFKTLSSKIIRKFITLNFENVKRREGGSPLPLVKKFRTLDSKTTREFKTLSFKKVEKGERGVHHYP